MRCVRIGKDKDEFGSLCSPFLVLWGLLFSLRPPSQIEIAPCHAFSAARSPGTSSAGGNRYTGLGTQGYLSQAELCGKVRYLVKRVSFKCGALDEEIIGGRIAEPKENYGKPTIWLKAVWMSNPLRPDLFYP